jgi:hypothetical protein
MANKRPAAALQSGTVGSFNSASYTKWVKSFDSRQQALQQMGCNVRCKGHCPRAVKKDGNVTFLTCRLRKSDPPCTWSAVLREALDSSVDLMQHATEWADHNQESSLLGMRGFSELQQRDALSTLLESTATTKPTTALRAARLAGTAGKVQLKQVQRLKKTMVRVRFGCKTLGELRGTVAKSRALPSRTTQGYFCHSFVSAPGQKKPKLTVVATTRKLQQRWVEATGSVAAVDGGFKFNLLGWPLHVLGTVNPAGRFTLHALGLTSTMESDHVGEMVKGFRDSIVRLTGCGMRDVNKPLAMSDGEAAYRKALADSFSSSNLMCYFHVKQAAKDNLMKRMVAGKDEKEETWASISADIDLAHAAHSFPDFMSRCKAIQIKWETEGLEEKTTWTDSLGRSYNFVSSFFKQWVQDMPEWYLGAAGDSMAPCTNNGAESCIKNVRSDAGNLVASVGEVLHFVLQQVEHVSANAFDPMEARKIQEALWQRAFLFSGLFGTDKIRTSTLQGRVAYCCRPRAEPEDDSVCNRHALPVREAQSATSRFATQLLGGETNVETIRQFAGPDGVRIFGFRGDVAFCTCPAFTSFRRCFHTLGLSIHVGKVELPPTLDRTLLTDIARKGNKRKQPSRGAVPLLNDQKDLRIAQLEAQVRKLHRSKGRPVIAEKALAVPLPSPETLPITLPEWTPKRRCSRKTANPERAIFAQAPGDILRKQQNAIALVQDALYLESDPAAGKAAFTPPVNAPRLEQELLVAANGRCFTNCCVAAANSEDWLRACRKPDGSAADLDRLVQEDDLARDFLLSKVLAAGMAGDRVSELVCCAYAEAIDFPYFAKAVQGSIGVVPPAAQSDVQGTRYYGEGPLKLKVGLYYLQDQITPHYKLLQSWM